MEGLTYVQHLEGLIGYINEKLLPETDIKAIKSGIVSIKDNAVNQLKQLREG